MAKGGTNVGTLQPLWLTDRTVETRFGSTLAKLRLANTEDHRRVLAVLTYLGAA